MPIITQCPSCDKKLKMKEPTPGKKVRCPACKEPFVPVAASAAKAGRKSAPKKKKRPAPVDDEFEDDAYGDDGYGDDDYEEEPRPKRAAAKGRQKASSKKKKAPAKQKSKAPLIIGASVLTVGLAAGLAYVFWPDSDGTGGGTAVADSSGDDQSEADMAHAMESGSHDAEDQAMASSVGMGSNSGMGTGGTAEVEADSDSGHGASEPSYSLGSATSGMSAPVTAAAGGSDFSSASSMQDSSGLPVTTSYSQDGPVDLSYLPAKAEAVAKIDVGRLLEGPLGQVLKLPQVAPQVGQFEQMLGVKPQDIESVTVGIGGLTDAIASGKEPNPMQLPLTAVIRTKVTLDTAKLQSAIPGGQTVTEGSMTYMRGPGPEVGGAIWFADSNTVVVGNEPSVKQVGTNPSTPTYVDAKLLDGTSPIQIMFSPTNPDAVFRHPQAKIPPQAPVPPAAMAVAKNFLANANGVFVGLDLTNDLGLNLSVRCKDSGSATQMVTDMKAATEESKAAQANQPPNPMMMPLMNIQKAMEESLSMTATEDIFRSTQSAKGGGQVLGSFVPMAMMMIGPAMQQAQTAAKRTQSKNNLKQIGLAMYNFNSVYQRFPNSASVDGSGRPLLSWRVHLLPFLGHERLYKQFALDEPWDSPTNMPLVDQMPDVYRSPQVATEPGQTIYMVPVGPGTAFEMQKGRGMREFTDGTSNTILLVEAALENAVAWTQPADLQFNPSTPKLGLRISPTGFQVVFADGSARFIGGQESDSKVKAMFTRNGAD